MFTPNRRIAGFASLAIVAVNLVAQSAPQPILSLSSGTVAPGQAIDVNVFLTSPGTHVPTTVQWTVGFPPASVDDVSVSPSSSVSGKTPYCVGRLGTVSCVLNGTNLNTIPNGTIGIMRVTASRSAVGSINLTVNALGAGPDAGSISIIAVGSTLNVAQVPFSLSSFTCSPSIVLSGGPISCTVSLSGTAASATSVSILSSSSLISIPSVAIVPAGTSSVTITGTAGVTTAPQPVTLSASLNGSVQRASLTVSEANPAPVISSLSPASAVAGTGNLGIIVTGSNFSSSSVVRWNDAPRTTIFINATALSASVSAADLANMGLAQVTVSTPAPGGGISGALPFTISAPPPVITQVQNAGSFLPGPMAPGSFVAISGNNLADQELQSDGNPLPTVLSSVSLTVNDLLAPLKAVSPNQINAQLPWNLLPSGAGTGTAQVILVNSAGKSAPVQIQLTTAAPGLFYSLTDASGVPRPAAVNGSDGSLPLPTAISYPGYTSRPATISDPGSLILFATGLGAVTNQPADGQPGLADPPFSTTLLTPDVLVGGVPAQVVFSGLSPQFPAVYQINVILQPGTPTGDAVPVQIRMNGITTTDQLKIAVSN